MAMVFLIFFFSFSFRLPKKKKTIFARESNCFRKLFISILVVLLILFCWCVSVFASLSVSSVPDHVWFIVVHLLGHFSSTIFFNFAHKFPYQRSPLPCSMRHWFFLWRTQCFNVGPYNNKKTPTKIYFEFSMSRKLMKIIHSYGIQVLLTYII